jgi:hypothetical protein
MKAPDNKHGESTGTAASSVHSVRVKIRSHLLANVTDKTFAFSDADWQRIVASLAPVGIDADAITVREDWWAPVDAIPVREDWWAHRDLMAEPRRPLREQLQNCVACYRGRAVCRKHGDFLTPRQEAAEIQEAVKTQRPLVLRSVRRRCPSRTRKVPARRWTGTSRARSGTANG